MCLCLGGSGCPDYRHCPLKCESDVLMVEDRGEELRTGCRRFPVIGNGGREKVSSCSSS